MLSITTWAISLYAAIRRWLDSGKWGKPQEDAQSDYDYAVEAIFNSPQGAKVLNQWLSDIYFQRSYIPGATPEDVAFHEGQREFVHTILETLDRVENAKQSKVAPVESVNIMEEYSV